MDGIIHLPTCGVNQGKVYNKNRLGHKKPKTTKLYEKHKIVMGGMMENAHYEGQNRASVGGIHRTESGPQPGT